MAGTAEVAASRLGDEPLAVPPVEVALGMPASAASLGEAEEPLEPRGRRGPQAEPLALASGAFEEPQRDWCIRQAGEPGAEATSAERPVGGQRPGAPGPSSWEGAGTTS
ncbi:MAG TPA: hypothetical protein VKO18_03970 [Terriglobia bacterium]|nr:hypothetical protein [Terriglobia bacterium]